jgi:methylthioribose-1-phosphate isomerase
MRMQAFAWAPSGRVALLDQTLLPHEERWIEVGSVEGIVEAIRALRVRGAPAIGITAAMGLVAALREQTSLSRDAFLAGVERGAAAILAARPTAVNLGWALDRMRRRASDAGGDARAILAALEAEAQAIWDEDRSACERIAEHGQALLVRRSEPTQPPSAAAPDNDARTVAVDVLTHCNTGFLATGGLGTALGIVHLAAERGKQLHVWVDETRPLLQGSRLTAWELLRANIPHTVIPDGAAAGLMARGKVDLVLVGADRIARNGDVANKLGTFPLAIAARRAGVAFYVVAPWSSFDPACARGDAIPIEERGAAELTAPAGSAVYNPAFDVTPAELITGYVTERGIVHPPFGD